MKLQQMCEEAARNSDRYDEFLVESGETMYKEDALHYFNVFCDGINEAYFAVSRQLHSPEKYLLVQTPESQIIDLDTLDPKAFQVRSVLSQDKTELLAFNFIDRNTIEVFTKKPVVIEYHYLPARLAALTDEPVFNESAVDPNLYVSMATARMWLSEKKPDLAEFWMQRYYAYLREVSGPARSSVRRIGRRMFR